MRIYSNYIAEFFEKLFKNLFFTTVYADTENDEDDPEENDGGSKINKGTLQINYEDLIKQARKEEKDKMYKRVKAAEEKERTAVANLNNTLLENGTLKEEVKTLKEDLKNIKSGDDSKTVKDLKTQINDLTEEIKTLKENGANVNEAEIRKQVEAEYEVKFYREQQINKQRSKILEVFDDIIDGKTKEEIDESIKKAIEKTKTAKEQMGINESDPDDEGDEENNEDVKPSAKKTAEKTVEKKKQPPVANPPSGSSKKQTLSADDIRNMPPEDYAALRKQLGLK